MVDLTVLGNFIKELTAFGVILAIFLGFGYSMYKIILPKFFSYLMDLQKDTWDIHEKTVTAISEVHTKVDTTLREVVAEMRTTTSEQSKAMQHTIVENQKFTLDLLREIRGENKPKGNSNG